MTLLSAWRGATLLSLSLGVSLGFTEPKGHIYWVGDNGLGRTTMDGSEIEWLVRPDLRRPGSIAIDEVRARIYWTHGTTIYRSNLDGSGLEDFTGELIHTDCRDVWSCFDVIDFGIDIDPHQGTIYLAMAFTHGDYLSGALYGLNLEKWERSDETELTAYLADGIYLTPYGTVVDPLNRRLYFLGRFGLGVASIDSELVGFGLVYTTEEMCVDATGYAYDLDFNHDDGVIYWSGPMGISRSNPEEGAESIAVLLDVPARQIALDAEGGRIYWAQVDGRILWSDLDGAAPQLVIDVSAMEYVEREPDVVDLAVSKGKVYWADRRGAIRRCNIDGSGLEDIFAPPVRRPGGGVFIDAAQGKVLWGDSMAGTVLQANLDGSELEALVSGLISVGDVLVHDNRLYWADPRARKVQSANRDGSDVQEIGAAEWEDSPQDLGIDSARGLIYWSEAASIYKANLDGSGKERILIEESRWIDDFAVDGEEERIYWVGNGLWRMDTQGGSREFLHSGGGEKYAVAVGPDRVYWSSNEHGYYWRDEHTNLGHSDKDGGDVKYLGRDEDSWFFLSSSSGRRHIKGMALHVPTGTSVSAAPGPMATALHANYPNPFNGATVIPYSLSRTGPVSLVIYNSLGQQVRTLVDEVQTAGAHTISWRPLGGDARPPLASGTYLCRLGTPEGSTTRKLTLLR